MKSYSFSNVDSLLNGIQVTDFADGTDVIIAERVNDAMSYLTGADGKVSMNISPDQSGTVTLKLKQTSPTSTQLQGHVQAAQNGAFTPLTFQMRDSARNDVITGTVGCCLNMAPMTRGDGVNTEEWTLFFEKLFLKTGSVSVDNFGSVVGSVLGGDISSVL